jgi:hypothetical protein
VAVATILSRRVENAHADGAKNLLLARGASNQSIISSQYKPLLSLPNILSSIGTSPILDTPQKEHVNIDSELHLSL